MQKHSKNPRRQNTPPSQKELFTGGKAAEFAVYFNVAFTKLLRTIHYLKERTIETNEETLDTKYGGLIDQFETGNVVDDLPDQIYSQLRNYIWKGYLNERNSAGYALDRRDKAMIQQLIFKLRALRNFHAHFYHDNAELAFSHDLKTFVTDLHNQAMYSFAGKHPEEIGFYQQNLLEHPLFFDNRYITQEGRTFFLSLFLTSGEVSRLLQQRRGSKKNEGLKYRIKHYIYRYYAHRDGAARKYYNLEEDLHDTLPESELRDLLNAQKFYKLNAQINDVPPFLHDSALLPLYIRSEAGEYVPCQTVQDLTVFCHENQLVETLVFKPVYNKDEEEKEGIIGLSIPEDTTFVFQFKKGDFHRLILDLIRFGEAEIIQRLSFFLGERQTLLTALESPQPESLLGTNGDTPITLLDYEKYKLRSNRRLKELFVEWLMAIENGLDKEAELRRKLLADLELAPIELRHFETYQGADQKPRTTDRFLEWCVEYLIDFGITPRWFWAFESFQTESKRDLKTGKTKEVLKKNIEFHAKKPADGNFRLCIDGEHILVKLSNRKTDRPFSIGVNAMRNIMIAVMDGGDKANSHIQLLLENVQNDLQTIENAVQTQTALNIDALPLLDRNSIPEVLLLQLQDAESQTKQAQWPEKTKSRLSHIIAELEKLAQDKTSMSRAAKNEQAMRCYQFFDWNPKFLRQNEYQQLSIFHYSLERITHLENKRNDTEGARYGKDKSTNSEVKEQLKYYASILNNICAENRARIPGPVDDVLQNATSLDDLLDRIIHTTLITLQKWLKTMQHGTAKEQALIAQRLKISQGAPKQPNAFPSFIPFSIHPLLVLRAFYKNGVKNAQGVKQTDLSKVSFSQKVRLNQALVGALRTENYDTKAYEHLLAVLPEKGQKNIKKKLIGAQNQQVAHDALLWYIASKYFETVSPNVRMMITGKKGTAIPASVGSLRQSTLNIPVVTNTQKQVQVELFFHQLDDTLFVESKEMLSKVVDYIYRRRVEEPEKYAEVKDDSLTYGEIVKEMARIQNEATIIARHLLAWEKNIVDAMTPAQITQYQEGMTLKRISFPNICQCAALPEADTQALNELRRHVFHLKTPVTFTYRAKTQEPSILNLLGPIEFKKDTTAWQK